MAPSSFFGIVSLFVALAGIHTGTVHAIPAEIPFAPDPDIVRDNAFLIFSTVHSAMRQWGSSLNHNGLSIFPATVPKGTLLYHGTQLNSSPPYPEWLAFEPQHSEAFARSFRGNRGHILPPPKRPDDPDRPKKPGPGTPPSDRTVVEIGEQAIGSQVVMSQAGESDGEPWPSEEPEPATRGYFHTYQANRDLKLLYLDGMSAGKTNMGTLDTQDFLLRGQEPGEPGRGSGMDERKRAQEICDLSQTWGVDGVIRMEIGFEIIYCDFSAGLDLVSMVRRPFGDDGPIDVKGITLFEWARAVSHRYDGIGAERVLLDYSGMVSGLFYPINITNPNPERPDLPRLIGATRDERRAILMRAADLARNPTPREQVTNWQGVTDQIVLRYSEELALLGSEEVTDEDFATDVIVLTTTFINDPSTPFDTNVVDVGNEDAEIRKKAVELCTIHYLQPAAIKKATYTPEDELIDLAIETVTRRICTDIYAIRALLFDAVAELGLMPYPSPELIASKLTSDEIEGLAEAVRAGKEIIRSLKDDLRWTTWKRCPGCAFSEICFVAMWPFGRAEDHYSPSCLNRTEVNGRSGFDMRHSYWDLEKMG